jgi:gamma-glutamyltranspeptidase/glutathione hydrolase
MRARAAALASDPDVEEVAKRELAHSNSAVAAVAAGFFAAAGLRADVLLGPLAVLVAGIGTGGRVFDGRLRQPGLEIKRPRGLLPGTEVPTGARVALPTGVAALTVALAHDRERTLTQVAKAGVTAARAAGARERQRVLERVASIGPSALSESTFVRPLLHVASPSQGGLLGAADFVAGQELSLVAGERRGKAGLTLELPWADRSRLPPGSDAIVAVDSRGVFAVLGYRHVAGGLPIEPLGLVAALEAVPVERGRARVRPGTRLPFVAALSIDCDVGGKPYDATARALSGGKRKAVELSVSQSDQRWVTATRK